MNFKSKTNHREFLTVKIMIEIYCTKKHDTKEKLCDECHELLMYSKKRLQLCPFHENKPACKDCSIHCYQKSFASRIIKVMKFSGPRMVTKHPILSTLHLLKSLKAKLSNVFKSIAFIPNKP